MVSEHLPRVYLDADVYVHVLGNQEHAEPCLRVLEAAERGDIRLIASRLVSVEVGGYKGDRPGEHEADELISRYLDGVQAEWVELDVMVARDARRIGWEHKLRAGDAIHFATALRRKADYFMSYDAAFPFDTIVSGMKVMNPDVVWQDVLF